MRIVVAVAILSLAAAGCASTADVPAPSPSTPDAQTPPAGAAKRKPPVEGELISPVIAFRGKGAEWNLQIENSGGWSHKVTWAWGTSPAANGSLVYAPGDDDSTIHLDGTLTTTEGDRPTKVTITAGDCVDDDSAHHDHAVSVAIAGLDVVKGCGDLAK